MDQIALIPMTQDEFNKRSRELAVAVRELAELEEQHKEARAEMKREHDEATKRIRIIAQSIREQGLRGE